MKRYIYLLYTLCLVLSACQEMDIEHEVGVGEAKLSLTISSTNNKVVSRAVSSDAEEKMIYNLSLFVFNQDGSKASFKSEPNVNKSESSVITWEKIPSGTGKTIVVIANVDNNNFNLTTDQLNSTTTKAELLALVATMNGDLTERGNTFLMSGLVENATLTPNQNNPINIKLHRLDAKIRFNITTATGVTFKPQDWRVCSVPRKVYVLPNGSNVPFPFKDNYFNSKWFNFEVSTEDKNTFAFYSLENKNASKRAIPTSGDYNTQYALREKRIKTNNGNGTVTNGAFEYAPDAGTYVELRGNVRYKPNDEMDISADVVYTVHLGAVGGVNDYNSLRNTAYTYNVNIVSVDKIIIEVDAENGEEPRPGSEGNVVIAKVIKEIDAYNEVFSLLFHQSSIDNTLTWNVDTPFSTGEEKDNPKDCDWIYFNLCTKGATLYNNTLITYSGDQKVYTDSEFNDKAFAHPLDKYMSDITAKTQKMLNIKQLTTILKECKKRYIDNQSQTPKKSHLLDASDNIRFTAYVKEYYYDTNPNNPSETVENGLWKKFVNEKKRVINILSNFKYSADGMSTKSNALYSIRQASIQTIYNRFSPAKFTAWGSQMIQDETQLLFDSQTYKNESITYSDKTNGRKNSIEMWGLSSAVQWSTYIDFTTWKMQTNYEYAKYKCLKLNRDMNGDGKIDKTEVQWYLSSENQLTDMWIGENSYNNDARLYKLPTWNLTVQWYASSTVTGRTGSKNNFRDNPQILWSSEGSSIGVLSGAGNVTTAKVYYRCVRNLGLPKDALESTTPDDIATYNASTGTISLDKLDEKSIRGFSTAQELSDHTERDVRGYNKPWTRFRIHTATHGVNLTWEQIRQRSQPNSANPVCPKGWRVPNQRELALMYSRMPKNETTWPLNNQFSRTGFSFGNINRPGFSINKGGGVLYLLNTVNETGGVRCVQDVP